MITGFQICESVLFLIQNVLDTLLFYINLRRYYKLQTLEKLRSYPVYYVDIIILLCYSNVCIGRIRLGPLVMMCFFFYHDIHSNV